MIVDSFYAYPPITVTLCESLTPALLHSDHRTVIWIRQSNRHQQSDKRRQSDKHLLAIGLMTFDMRFRPIHKDMSEDYLLQILPVQVRESRM